MRRTKLINLIIAVISAIVIWFFTVLVINPETGRNFTNISLDILNEKSLSSKGLLIASISKKSFEVNVKGKRQDVLALNDTDISASIDVLGLGLGKHTLVPSFTELNNISIETFEPTKIIINIVKLEKKKIPVKVEFLNKNPDYTYSVESIDTPMINARGASGNINKVSYFLVRINLLNEKKDKEFSLIPVPISKNDKQISDIDYDDGFIKVKVKIVKRKK